MKNIISLKSDIKLVTQINSQQFFSDKDKLMTKLEGMERTRIKKKGWEWLKAEFSNLAEKKRDIGTRTSYKATNIKSDKI